MRFTRTVDTRVPTRDSVHACGEKLQRICGSFEAMSAETFVVAIDGLTQHGINTSRSVNFCESLRQSGQCTKPG